MSKNKIYKKKNKTIKNLTRNILQVLNKDSKLTFNYKQIAAKLKIKDFNGKQQVLKKLIELTGNQKIKEIDRGKFQIIPTEKYYYGKTDINARGNGYVICEELEHDIYIPNRNLNHALHNDLVKVYAYKRKANGKQEGDIVEITERAKTDFVGVLQRNKNFGFVVPDNNKMYVDVFVPLKKIKDAEDGDKVVVSIQNWPENSKNPFGEIIEVLGKPGDHDTEMHSILMEYNLPYKFPEKVEKDAAKLPIEITNKEIAKRRDFRDTLTFTIDPATAKDFDDALSFKTLENGNYEIGIHIADVSHYVQEGTILEDEAYARATSVYLVDRVVPMLPEVLSNNVCSLRPHEEKLTFSAVFELDKNANLKSQWFGRTIIYSDARFAYEEAQVIIESNQSSVGSGQSSVDGNEKKLTFNIQHSKPIVIPTERGTNNKESQNNSKSNIHNSKLNLIIPKTISLTQKEYQVTPEIGEAIVTLNKLAQILRKERMQNGALSFDRAEVRFNLDENANPISVFFKTQKDANKLIEEFMLLANKKVAQFIGKNKIGQPTKRTFIYRIHDEPDLSKLADLQRIVANFGYKIQTDTRERIAQSLNQLLKDVKGKPEQNMVETLTIRSMSKAIYTTQNIGHYGLSFDYYSHFTSPIRRYPDVMTHRLLQHYLDGGKSPNATEYEDKCEHSSEREYMATKAERDSIKYMQVKYMQDHQNKIFKGVITGVTEWGIYVEIIENKCEGMVRVKDIKDDYYTFDEKQYAMVGQATQNSITLGDEVLVKVKNTDLERKRLDFYLVQDSML